MRPRLGKVAYERAVAFAVLGLLFGLGYPDWPWITLAGVVASALLLEAIQTLVPGRHGRMADAMQKMAGGVIGWAAAALIVMVV
jgi:VanZ family protein